MAKARPKIAPSDPVDLNEASEAELKSVPGITVRTAKKIVEGRPYASVSELSNAGLSKATIKRIRKNVTVAGQPTGTATKPAPRGNASGMVWVSPESKVYHQPGDKWYGKTRDGQYMKESEAIEAGYRPSKQH